MQLTYHIECTALNEKSNGCHKHKSIGPQRTPAAASSYTAFWVALGTARGARDVAVPAGTLAAEAEASESSLKANCILVAAIMQLAWLGLRASWRLLPARADGWLAGWPGWRQHVSQSQRGCTSALSANPGPACLY